MQGHPLDHPVYVCVRWLVVVVCVLSACCTVPVLWCQLHSGMMWSLLTRRLCLCADGLASAGQMASLIYFLREAMSLCSRKKFEKTHKHTNSAFYLRQASSSHYQILTQQARCCSVSSPCFCSFLIFVFLPFPSCIAPASSLICLLFHFRQAER